MKTTEFQNYVQEMTHQTILKVDLLVEERLREVFPFNEDEIRDILAACAERGISVRELIHDLVMDDIAGSATWGNERP